MTGTDNRDETSISNRVTTVRVPKATFKDIKSALNQNFSVSSPRQLADHVMYCLPPDGMNGIAYAYVNFWVCIYSDTWCHSVSTQMHKIGHNLGLAHSEEGGAAYAD